MQPNLPVLDISTMQRVRGQIGSNPGGIYLNTDGQKFYVKTLESPMHARNEWLAAKLYQLAGAPTLTYVPCADPCQIATKWINLDKKFITHFSVSERKQAQQWFAVHAWTANWDAAGFDGDNQGVADGTVLTLDVGGALCYKALGDPKGLAFGTDVTELTILRTDKNNPYALQLFSCIDSETLRQSIQIVTNIPDKNIHDTIIENGGSQKLADKMIARKNYMIQHYNQI